MKIGFIGAGKMAEGILQAVLTECVSAKDIIMGEKNPDRMKEIRARYGVEVTSDLKSVVKAANYIFLAVRPQDIGAVSEEIKAVLTERKLLISIVAGKRLAKLRTVFGRKVRLVRVMPNLALRVKEGMCAVCGARNVKRDDVKTVCWFLDGAGEVIELKEKDFDAVTALSGSGPAFYAYMEKAMIDGGIALGLHPLVARRLAEQTMLGTVAYVKSASADLEAFIGGVCTKGGTTAAGMDVMAKSDFRKVVMKTLAAAAKRSAELA